MKTDVFRLTINYKSWDKKQALPLYVAGNYEIDEAIVSNNRFIVMMSPIGDLPTLPAMKKHIEKIQKIDDVPVAFYLKNLSDFRRKGMLESNIPFMTEKQVFLPFIGTLLMEEKNNALYKEKFMFSTQQLFLMYLYNRQNKLYVANVGKKLPYSAMTLSRAVKQLEASDLFLVYKDGVNKVIESKYDRRELFERAKPFLLDPVRKYGYIEKSRIDENMVLASESALAKNSMLNPSKLITYAIDEQKMDINQMENELVDPNKQIRLELWGYDPKLFSDDNVADGLSVALSLREIVDERIEEAIDECIERELNEK
ncbi:MarR family transcriptional regulator [Holdemanella porci]|uniref:MarR family transcriptional regulator n=1 Tax=Holdemanella porci TaxID=2652276 RepID=UPI001C2610B3|nr:MarR family transcriptional regulator [Holdemanella porci]MBU9130806.1 MarR family transcriptional regulator [Holdemanella porci]MBU9872645.1 MarR family transcriptional regulator [Holdemanella porci]MBU9887646.1 MarR family transcriptional regulator [Holdemanella porci]